MATPEFVERNYDQAIPYETPKTQPRPSAPQQPEPKKRPKIFTKKELFAICVMSVFAFILVFGNLITQVTISNQNRNLQDLLVNNQQVTVENDNLSQEVQELSRYNRIMEIAEELGLEMNEENVRNVSR